MKYLRFIGEMLLLALLAGFLMLIAAIITRQVFGDEKAQCVFIGYYCAVNNDLVRWVWKRLGIEKPQDTNAEQSRIDSTARKITETTRDKAEAGSYEFAECRQQIRGAAESMDVLEAIKAVSRIWEQLDECIGLAEARMRVLLKKTEPPRLREEPQWLKEQAASLRRRPLVQHNADDALDDMPLSGAIESARLLVLACLGQLNSKHSLSMIRPILEPGPLGRVLVSWKLDRVRRLHWMVQAPELAWPGISIISMHRRGMGKDASREIKALHIAEQAVAQFNEILNM